MAWDLRSALLKKQEVESARLADFEFRLRARTMRLLAPLVDADLSPQALAQEIATSSDEAILDDLARRFPAASERIDALYRQCRSTAREDLIRELGDPSPHRLS